jgi:hypothetical protein
MSEGASDNKSLFRVDLERALEALELNLQKKSNAVKNIVPYCHDMGNALDGLALFDMSQAAIELAQLYKDAKTVQAHRHILEDFQDLIRYQLELTEEQSSQQTLQEYKLKKQAFFSKLHIVQPSRLTLEFVRHDIEESIITDGQQDSNLTEKAAELLSDLETQVSKAIQDQNFPANFKKFYSVQDLLDQEKKEPPTSPDLSKLENLQAVDSTSLAADSSTDDHKMSSPLISHNVFDYLEQSINELDARLKSADPAVPFISDKHNQQEPVINQEEADEPFYIDFPYSREAKNGNHENDGSLEEELTPKSENSNLADVNSLDILSEPQELALPPKVLVEQVTNLSNELNIERQAPNLEFDTISSDLIQNSEIESLVRTRLLETETSLEPIEDPFAELDKLSEQFSIAAHKEQLYLAESPVTASPVLEPKDTSIEDEVPLLKVVSIPEVEMINYVEPLPVVESDKTANFLQDSSNISEVGEVNAIKISENVIENKSNSNLDDWIDHSIANALTQKTDVLPVVQKKRKTIDFDVQRALNKLQQARGLLPKDASFQIQILDGLIEDQQNTVVQSVQVDVGEAFNGLAETVESDHVYADQNIIERLLSILSIFPPQKTISMVQQRLLVFIDLQGPLPSEDQLHTANNYLAQICGSLEIKPELIRITVPSSLLRMEMFCYKRNEDMFAVPISQLIQAHQYTHDDVLPESSLWDVHGVIEGPHHRISLRSGITEHQIYSFETIGSKILNIFEEFSEDIKRPIWLGALGIDGQNRFYHCVFLERFAA